MGSRLVVKIKWTWLAYYKNCISVKYYFHYWLWLSFDTSFSPFFSFWWFRKMNGIITQWFWNVYSLYLLRPLEKAMASHSSTLAWKIPWMEEPGRLQSMGSLRIGHDWATSLSLSCTGEGNGNPLECSCPENPGDGRAWWGSVYGVAQSWTRLKRLSSSSSSYVHIIVISAAKDSKPDY